MTGNSLRGLLAGLMVLTGGTAAAAPIAITGYDVVNASVSGTGGWAHVYTGTITPTGTPSFANYTGGTGTMADGVFGTSSGNTQLFCEVSTCGGNSANVATITLFLGGTHNVSSLSIFGGSTGNTIPGAITGMDVTIGGSTVTIASTQFGPLGNSGQLVNDLVTLTGTGLENLATSTVVLSNITYNENGSTNLGRYSIAEITLDGAVANGVPEPATLAMVGAVLALAGARRRARRDAA